MKIILPLRAEFGRCQCGCGNLAPIATRTDKRWGAVKGKPRRFISGHNRLSDKNADLPHGKIRNAAGYILCYVPDHPRAVSGYIFEHILIAEQALGRYLKDKEEVHHINSIKEDNRNENLVICPDRSYHFLLHQRTRALEVSGHAHWRPCEVCTEHDDPSNMSPHRNAFYHKKCAAESSRKQRAIK